MALAEVIFALGIAGEVTGLTLGVRSNLAAIGMIVYGSVLLVKGYIR